MNAEKHEFQTRFNVENIQEFYASTEGNCNLLNSENQPLSVGFLPTGFGSHMISRNHIKNRYKEFSRKLQD